MSYLARLQAFQDHPAAKHGNAALIPASVPFVSTPFRIVQDAKAASNDRNTLLGALDIPNEWKRGLISLGVQEPPPHVGAARWAEIIADTDYVAVEWGERAAHLGWRDLDLFGCSPGLARRLDRDGLVLLLFGRKIQTLTERHATITVTGGVQTFLRSASGESVPAWEASVRP